MKTEDWRSLPEEIQMFVFESDLLVDQIAKKFGLDAPQVNFINDLLDELFLKKTEPLDLPKRLDEMPNSKDIDIRLLSLDVAYKALWPLNDYLESIDRLILRLGGKVPGKTPIKLGQKQSEAGSFPSRIQGTVREMLSKYSDFKDLRLSAGKIADKKGLHVAGSVANWIEDYVHFVGAGGHDSLKRAKYLAKSPNVLALSDQEKESLRQFFVSYDENVPVLFDNKEAVLRVKEPEKTDDSLKTSGSFDPDHLVYLLDQKLRKLAEEILPSDIILSEAEQDIKNVHNILWQSIGIQDQGKTLSCLRLLIEKKYLDAMLMSDNRFKNILKRFVSVKYGRALEEAVSDKTDRLILRRLFLEMVLSDKLRLADQEAKTAALYLTNLVPAAGQVVYWDKKTSQLNWREIRVVGQNFAWVDNI